MLSVNRETIAATLLELWEVPEEVSTSIRFQWVDDYDGSHASYVSLIRIAKNLLADHQSDFDPMPDALFLPQELIDQAQALGIDEPKLARVAETVLSAKQDLKDLSRQMTR